MEDEGAADEDPRSIVFFNVRLQHVELGQGNSADFVLFRRDAAIKRPRRPGVRFATLRLAGRADSHRRPRCTSGRRPIAAFGNSDADLQMLQWTTAGADPRFALYVHHTDAARESAYDRGSSIGRRDQGLDEAAKQGWTVVDMKSDWKTIFPDGHGPADVRHRPRCCSPAYSWSAVVSTRCAR